MYVCMYQGAYSTCTWRSTPIRKAVADGDAIFNEYGAKHILIALDIEQLCEALSYMVKHRKIVLPRKKYFGVV